MKYKVLIKKKVLKKLSKLPIFIQKKAASLFKDLENKGPIQSTWKNFSKLGENEYHCHLAYSYVACWYHEKGEIIIEVYYVGSREDAPY